jgi:hypothetical protein
MKENIKLPKTIDNKNNQAEQLSALVEYGKNNGGWNDLLSLRSLERDVFLVDSSWQEAQKKGADGSVPGLDVIEKEVGAINDRMNILNELVKDIQDSLQRIQGVGISEKKDAGVIMRVLLGVNVSELNNSQGEIVGKLLGGMEKFRGLYEEWKKYHRQKFEELIEVLKAVNSGNFKNKPNGLYAERRYNDPSQHTRGTTRR